MTVGKKVRIRKKIIFKTRLCRVEFFFSKRIQIHSEVFLYVKIAYLKKESTFDIFMRRICCICITMYSTGIQFLQKAGAINCFVYSHKGKENEEQGKEGQDDHHHAQQHLQL